MTPVARCLCWLRGAALKTGPPFLLSPKAVMSPEDGHQLTSSQLLIPGDFADATAVSENSSICAYLHGFCPLDTGGTACLLGCEGSGEVCVGVQGQQDW